MSVNAEARKAADEIARQPSFWPQPDSPSLLAAAIQYPLDERWAGRVINAYVRKARFPSPEVRE